MSTPRRKVIERFTIGGGPMSGSVEVRLECGHRYTVAAGGRYAIAKTLECHPCRRGEPAVCKPPTVTGDT